MRGKLKNLKCGQILTKCFAEVKIISNLSLDIGLIGNGGSLNNKTN